MEGINLYDINKTKSKIEKMKNQVDFLMMQNTGMSPNPTKEQLFDLSFQLINNGIYVYLLGQKKLGFIDYDKLKEKLQKISEEIIVHYEIIH